MKMEKPTVEAVRFTSADVIATSGQLGVTLSGFGDNGDPYEKNNTFTVGRKDYTPADSSQEDVIAALVDAGQPSGLTPIFHAAGETYSLDQLWSTDNPELSVYNGTYTWYQAGSYWERSGD